MVELICFQLFENTTKNTIVPGPSPRLPAWNSASSASSKLRRPPPTGRLFVSPRQEERKEREGEKDTFSRECFLSQFVKVLVLQIYPLCISPPPSYLSFWMQRGKVKLVLCADSEAEFLGWYSTLEKILQTFQVYVTLLEKFWQILLYLTNDSMAVWRYVT